MRALCIFILIALFLRDAECAGNIADLRAEFMDRMDTYIFETIEKNDDDLVTELFLLYFETGDMFNGSGLQGTIDRCNSHEDGVDFSLHELAWILTHFWYHPKLTNQMKADVVSAVTNIPLFLDYDGYIGSMQYWSENHQIGWYAAEYLIGSAFARDPTLSSIIFTPSNQTGAFHAEVGRRRVERWLNFRLKYGFSEFNSDTYGPIAYKALVSVVGCAPDPAIQDLATIVMNLQLYDHILGSQGVKLATARGRAYGGRKLGTGSYNHMWLIKGSGTEADMRSELGNSQSVYLTLCVIMGRYTLPDALLEVGDIVESEQLTLEQRFGLDEYAGEVTVDDAENCTFWTGNGAYFCPTHPRCLFVMGDTYDLWDRTDTWTSLKPAKIIWDTDPFIVDSVGEIGAPLGHGSVLGPANMRTFKRKGLMLSSVQNYKGGFMAGQQQAWQATLDKDRYGTVFSIQSTASAGNEDSDDYWVGGILPNIGQHGSTLIAMYSPEVLNTAVFSLSITHAHFRHQQYDEFARVNNEDGSVWLIGAQGDVYVALYSHNGGEFVSEEEGTLERDFVSQGVQNVYICETGSQEMNGSFAEFAENIQFSQVQVDIFYNDSLLECLVDNNCLAGIVQLADCLLNVCRSRSEADFVTELQELMREDEIFKISQLQSVTDQLRTINEPSGLASLLNLQDKQEWKIFSLIATRLRNTRKSDVEVSYLRNSTQFQFGWDRDMTVDGHIIQTDDFMRYNNRFTEMAWEQRNITISTPNANLVMDFDAATILQ